MRSLECVVSVVLSERGYNSQMFTPSKVITITVVVQVYIIVCVGGLFEKVETSETN